MTVIGFLVMVFAIIGVYQTGKWIVTLLKEHLES